MQTKYYGSIMVSKTMGVGSTPTVCDLYEEYYEWTNDKYAYIISMLCTNINSSMYFSMRINGFSMGNDRWNSRRIKEIHKWNQKKKLKD